MEGIIYLGIICGLIAFVTQGFRLGQPYIEMRYFAGSQKYYVWIRRFMGYDDLVGACDTEQQAKDLLERVRASPPKTIRPR
jgi:hypothetical protein